ncbi:MAG: hypothetical protein ACI9O6_000531 [Glaciecola sp.]|jgi:hypothetical protein
MKVKVLKQSHIQKRRRNMIRAISGLILFVLILAVIGVFLRDALLKRVISHYFSEQSIQVNCLETHLRLPLTVDVDDLCLSSPNFTLRLQNATWLHLENMLTVEQMDIEHVLVEASNSNEQSDPSENSYATIDDFPNNMPKVLIKQLKLDSPLLVSPLNIEIDFTSSDTLKVAGDIQANLKIENSKLRAKLDWHIADLVLIPAVKNMYSQYDVIISNDMLERAVSSDITFDGLSVESLHKVAFGFPVNLKGCNFDLELEGNIALNIPNIATTEAIFADFSDLLMQAKFPKCVHIPEELNDWDFAQMSIQVPEVISFYEQKLVIPKLKVEPLNMAAQKQDALSLALQDLKFDVETEQASTQFELYIEQSLPSPKFSQGRISLLSTGSANAELSDSGSLEDSRWQFNSVNVLNINALKNEQIELARVDSEFTASGDQDKGLYIDGQLDLSKAHFSSLEVNDVSAKFGATLSAKMQIESFLEWQSTLLVAAKANVTDSNGVMKFAAKFNRGPGIEILARFNDVTASGNIEAKKLNTAQIQVSNINSQFIATGPYIDNILVTGHTSMTPNRVQFDDYRLKLDKLNIEHKITSNLSLVGTESRHDLTLSKGFKALFSQKGYQVNLSVNDQKITDLSKITSQILPSLSLSQGIVNAQIDTSFINIDDALSFEGELHLSDTSGSFSNSLFTGVKVDIPFIYNEQGLSVAQGEVAIASINAGIPVENIHASLLSENSGLKLSQLKGSILGGQLSLKELWLDNREQTFDLILQDLDLQKVAALQDQPGIQVRGKMMGKLPLIKSTSGISIDQGRMLSQDGGKLTIKQNPAFDTIKQQQPELAYLEDYQFTQLSSKLSLQTDGKLVLDLAFTGKNEAKKQAVNFNYNHQENIFDLLKAKRIANGIQDKIERSITQGAKQ